MMCVSNHAIARNLKKARKCAGITQAKTAELLGMSILHYGRLERGKRSASLDELDLIAEIFDTSIQSLLLGATMRLLDSKPAQPDDFSSLMYSLVSGCSEQSRMLMIDICQRIAMQDKFASPCLNRRNITKNPQTIARPRVCYAQFTRR